MLPGYHIEHRADGVDFVRRDDSGECVGRVYNVEAAEEAAGLWAAYFGEAGVPITYPSHDAAVRAVCVYAEAHSGSAR